MRSAEIITSSFLLLLAVVVVYESFRLGFGWGLEGPQPGFFIFWLGLGLAFCSLTTIGHALFDGSVLGVQRFINGRMSEVLRVLLPMVGAVLLMEFFGFYVASAVYLAFFMRWVGSFSWAMVLLVAALFASSHYVVFEKIFLVPLPKGILEPYIGF